MTTAADRLKALLQTKGIDPSLLKEISDSELTNALQNPENNDIKPPQEDVIEINGNGTISNLPLKNTSSENAASKSPVQRRRLLESDTRDKRFKSLFENLQDLDKFSLAYLKFNNFLENNCPDKFKHELNQFLYPLFVYCYISLIDSNFIEQAGTFFNTFSSDLWHKYKEGINELSGVTVRDHLVKSEICKAFKSSKFAYHVKIKNAAHKYLFSEAFKAQEEVESMKPIIDILESNQKIRIEILNDDKTDNRGNIAVGSLILGNIENFTEKTDKQSQKQILTGPTLFADFCKQIVTGQNLEEIVSDEEREQSQSQGTSVRKSKLNIGSLRKRQNEVKKKFCDGDGNNVPQFDRIPLDKPGPFFKREIKEQVKDAIKRTELGNGKNLPTILNYTILNSLSQISADAVSHDSSMYAHTIKEGNIVRIWTLTKSGLLTLRPYSQLKHLDIEGDHIWQQIWDEDEAMHQAKQNKKNHQPSKNNILPGVSGACYQDLVGHSGRIFAISFSADKHYIITAGEDSTIRLWSVFTWSCIVIFKCGPSKKFPILSLNFAPYGRYFVSGGADNLARLWSTSEYHPMRIFYGHTAEVNVVKFHPNCNYIATGSDDRSIRLWDVLSGECVRIFQTYNQKEVLNLSFSPCGKLLASSDSDFLKIAVIWDLSSSKVYNRIIFDSEKRIGRKTKNQTKENKDEDEKLLSEYDLKKHQKIKSFITDLSFSRDNNEVIAICTSDGRVNIYNYTRINDSADLKKDGSLNVNKSESSDLIHLNDNSEKLVVCKTKSKSCPMSLVHFTRRNLILSFGSVNRSTLVEN